MKKRLEMIAVLAFCSIFLFFAVCGAMAGLIWLGFLVGMQHWNVHPGTLPDPGYLIVAFYLHHGEYGVAVIAAIVTVAIMGTAFIVASISRSREKKAGA